MQNQSINSKFSRILSNIIFEIADFFAPKVCLACDSKIDFEYNVHRFLCVKCLNSLPYYASYEDLLNRFILKFGKDKVYLRRVNSLLDISQEDKYLNVMHSFKYQGMQESAYEFGKMLGKKLIHDGFMDYDAIIPLPIHHARERERGYNQAYHIALGLTNILQIPTNIDYVKRVRYTTTQTKLNAEQRSKNLANAFKSSELAFGKRLLLVDDVLTTGSTLNNCAKALINSGAEYVDAATLGAR